MIHTPTIAESIVAPTLFRPEFSHSLDPKATLEQFAYASGTMVLSGAALLGMRSMGATFTPIAALLLSAAILLMGNGLQSTLLPLRAEIEVFSTFNIGILGSTYYIGFAAGCIWAPRLVRSVGHIRTFTAMVAIASVAPLVHNILPSVVLWWLVRALTGFCLAALFMIIESWLHEKATNENRGVVFSAYTIISLTVVTLGQLMINVSEPAPSSCSRWRQFWFHWPPCRYR